MPAGIGAGAGGRRPGLHRGERGDAPQHPVRRPLGPRAARRLLRELLRPPVPAALGSTAVPLAAGGGGAGPPVLGVLGADAVAAAAAASAPPAAALAVATHAAAGAVSPGRGLRLGLALLRPRRLPTPSLLILRSTPLVLQNHGRDQRAGALSGGAGGQAARLIGRRGFAAAAFIVGKIDRVTRGGGGYTFAFRLLVLVRRGLSRGVAGGVHPALHRQELGRRIECRAPLAQDFGLRRQRGRAVRLSFSVL